MKKGWLMKFSLLSISLVLTSASVISGNIPAMAKSFLDVPLSSIEMLTTVPALMVLIFVLLSSFFCEMVRYEANCSARSDYFIDFWSDSCI